MLVVKAHPKSMVAESYRKLRTNIESISSDSDLKTILVTSSEDGEGKSTVAINLAYTMMENDKKVLLIDCDLRKPTLNIVFKVSNVCGLTKYLMKKCQLFEAIRLYNDNLNILPTGEIPLNPSELLSSNAMRGLLKELKGIYDYIIIDSPPLMTVTDGQVLARICDGTVLVIAKEETKKTSVIQGYEELKKVRANIVGVVFNSKSEKKG